MNNFWQKLKTTLEMIKFEHTIFALPFAFLGAILAANGLPTWWQILWITVAMVGARSAAMSLIVSPTATLTVKTRVLQTVNFRVESYR